MEKDLKKDLQKDLQEDLKKDLKKDLEKDLNDMRKVSTIDFNGFNKRIFVSLNETRGGEKLLLKAVQNSVFAKELLPSYVERCFSFLL